MQPLLTEILLSFGVQVVLWREGLPVYPPPAFIWEGRNYLLKMHADLDFLADAQPLVTALRVAAEKVYAHTSTHTPDPATEYGCP